MMFTITEQVFLCQYNPTPSRAFHVSQRGSLMRSHARIVGSSRYTSPLRVLRRVKMKRTCLWPMAQVSLGVSRSPVHSNRPPHGVRAARKCHGRCCR